MYLETYGCQMNVNDTEIAWAILQKSGYLRTHQLEEVWHCASYPDTQGLHKDLLWCCTMNPWGQVSQRGLRSTLHEGSDPARC